MGILLFPILKVFCDLCVQSESTARWISATMFLKQRYAVSKVLVFPKLEPCLLWSLLSTPIGLMTFPELANTWMMWFSIVHIMQNPGSKPSKVKKKRDKVSKNKRHARLKWLLGANTHKFLSAPASACSWWMEPCRSDTAGLSSGSRCCPCSLGLHRCCGSGSTSCWGAQQGTGPSGATLSHHQCHSLDTHVQQAWLLTERCCLSALM